MFIYFKGFLKMYVNFRGSLELNPRFPPPLSPAAAAAASSAILFPYLFGAAAAAKTESGGCLLGNKGDKILF